MPVGNSYYCQDEMIKNVLASSIQVKLQPLYSYPASTQTNYEIWGQKKHGNLFLQNHIYFKKANQIKLKKKN